jgi:hypothetical protein
MNEPKDGHPSSSRAAVAHSGFKPICLMSFTWLSVVSLVYALSAGAGLAATRFGGIVFRACAFRNSRCVKHDRYAAG